MLVSAALDVFLFSLLYGHATARRVQVEKVRARSIGRLSNGHKQDDDMNVSSKAFAPMPACVDTRSSTWDRPYGNVAISKAGAESCQTKCKNGGYKYFGLECPMGTNVHCQCTNAAASWSQLSFELCEGKGDPVIHVHHHCVGPYVADGYRFGDGYVGAAYLTDPEAPQAFSPSGSQSMFYKGYQYIAWPAIDRYASTTEVTGPQTLPSGWETVRDNDPDISNIASNVIKSYGWGALVLGMEDPDNVRFALYYTKNDASSGMEQRGGNVLVWTRRPRHIDYKYRRTRLLLRRLQATTTPCEDTVGWINGHGYDCSGYVTKGWCKDGGFVKGQEWTGTAQYRYPEQNCIACGKTCQVATTLCEDTVGWTNPHGYDCSGYVTKGWCKDGGFVEGQEWTGTAQYWYPEENCIACGKTCQAPTMPCQDTAGWINPHGHDCSGYVTQGWCKDGGFVKGQEWTGTAKFRYPEKNCIACGKTCQAPHFTCGGTAGGAPCVFPFTYSGTEYQQCTTDGHTEPWCYTQSDNGKWGNCNCIQASYVLWSDSKMCQHGRWFPNEYAYANGGGGPTQVGVDGFKNEISLERALATGVEYCAQAMAGDSTCSKDFIGVAHNNGHCWCVDPGKPCEKATADGWWWQFKSTRSFTEAVPSTTEKFRKGMCDREFVSFNFRCRQLLEKSKALSAIWGSHVCLDIHELEDFKPGVPLPKDGDKLKSMRQKANFLAENSKEMVMWRDFGKAMTLEDREKLERPNAATHEKLDAVMHAKPPDIKVFVEKMKKNDLVREATEALRRRPQQVVFWTGGANQDETWKEFGKLPIPALQLADKMSAHGIEKRPDWDWSFHVDDVFGQYDFFSAPKVLHDGDSEISTVFGRSMDYANFLEKCGRDVNRAAWRYGSLVLATSMFDTEEEWGVRLKPKAWREKGTGDVLAPVTPVVIGPRLGEPGRRPPSDSILFSIEIPALKDLVKEIRAPEVLRFLVVNLSPHMKCPAIMKLFGEDLPHKRTLELSRCYECPNGKVLPCFEGAYRALGVELTWFDKTLPPGFHELYRGVVSGDFWKPPTDRIAEDLPKTIGNVVNHLGGGDVVNNLTGDVLKHLGGVFR